MITMDLQKLQGALGMGLIDMDKITDVSKSTFMSKSGRMLINLSEPVIVTPVDSAQEQFSEDQFRELCKQGYITPETLAGKTVSKYTYTSPDGIATPMVRVSAVIEEAEIESFFPKAQAEEETETAEDDNPFAVENTHA